MFRACVAVLVIAAMLPFAYADDEDTTNASNYKPVTKADRLTLRAIGNAKAHADFVKIQFNIYSSNEDAKDAQRNLEQRVCRLKKALNLPEVAPVDTFSVTMGFTPTRLRYGEKEGFTYARTCVIRFSNVACLPDPIIHEVIADMLDRLTQVDVSSDNLSIFYDVNDPDVLSAQAYELAVTSARERARAIAKKSGRKLGKMSAVADDSRIVNQDVLFGITDTRSSDSTVERQVVLYVEFDLE